MREERDLLGFTPLLHAATRGDAGAVLRLLDSGADANAAAIDGWTPLFAAARSGDAATVRALLERGARVDAHFRDPSVTALSIACFSGARDVVDVLVRAGLALDEIEAARFFIGAHRRAGRRVVFTREADPSRPGLGSTEEWTVDGSLDLDDDDARVVAAFAQRYAPRGSRGDLEPWPLVLIGACEFSSAGRAGGMPRGVDDLFSILTFFTPTADAADHLASSSGDPGPGDERLPHDVRQRLIEVAVDSASWSSDALEGERARAEANAIARLLRHTTPRVRALEDAIVRDRADLVELLAPPLLASGAPLRFAHQVPALSFAAFGGRARCVAALLALGAPVDDVNQLGETALASVAGQPGPGALDAALALLEAGADPNHRDATGRTPVHAAAGARHLDVLARLLERGGDVHARDRDARTPLHLAVLRARTGEAHARDVVELLLGRGADPGARDDAGLRALELAERATERNDDVIAALRAATRG